MIKKVFELDNTLKNEISEAILRYAVNENHKREMAAIPSNDELAKLYSFTERHDNRMKALFIKESRKEMRVKMLNISRRVAVIFLIATTVLFGVLLTNQQVRASVGQIITEWFEQFTRFIFTDSSISKEPAEWYPVYIPDGFEETGINFIASITNIEYKNQENELITFNYSLSGDIAISVDNEHYEYDVVIYDGVEYHVFQAISHEYKTKIIWLDNGYSFMLNSSIDSDELMQMAKSVAIKK